MTDGPTLNRISPNNQRLPKSSEKAFQQTKKSLSITSKSWGLIILISLSMPLLATSQIQESSKSIQNTTPNQQEDTTQNLLDKIQNNPSPKDILTIAKIIPHEENPNRKTLLLQILKKSATNLENRNILIQIHDHPPIGKTRAMKTIEHQIEQAKKRLAKEAHATPLLGKKIHFKDLQFYLRINHKTPESLKELEQTANFPIRCLGTLPTQTNQHGKPMQWKLPNHEKELLRKTIKSALEPSPPKNTQKTSI